MIHDAAIGLTYPRDRAHLSPRSRSLVPAIGLACPRVRWVSVLPVGRLWGAFSLGWVWRRGGNRGQGGGRSFVLGQMRVGFFGVWRLFSVFLVSAWSFCVVGVCLVSPGPDRFGGLKRCDTQAGRYSGLGLTWRSL